MQKDLLNRLLNKFKISKKDFEDHKSHYNLNFDKYGNEIYEDVKTRIVHLSNFSEDNWFNRRYELLFKESLNFDSVVEVGFSLPYLLLISKKRSKSNCLS